MPSIACKIGQKRRAELGVSFPIQALLINSRAIQEFRGAFFNLPAGGPKNIRNNIGQTSEIMSSDIIGAENMGSALRIKNSD